MSTPNADPVGDLAGHHPQLRERVRRVLEPFGRSYYQACVARGEPVRALWQALALQGDVTRVITFQLARETSTRTYPEIGVPDPHHPLTHNGGDLEKLARVAKINAFHVSLFAYFLEKLKSIPEGDGNLLSNSMIVYGAGLADGNRHSHEDLPTLLAGHGGGTFQGQTLSWVVELPAARRCRDRYVRLANGRPSSRIRTPGR